MYWAVLHLQVALLGLAIGFIYAASNRARLRRRLLGRQLRLFRREVGWLWLGDFSLTNLCWSTDYAKNYALSDRSTIWLFQS